MSIGHSTVYSTQGELELGLDFVPSIVREHGLRDAHLRPLVARRKGQSFRVHARDAWGFPSLELRAGNSWPAVTLDCDLPTVVDALHALKSNLALPVPNVVVERVSNGHCHASWFLSRPVHRGESARAAPMLKLGRVSEFYRQTLEADAGYAGVLTHNPLEETHRAGEFRTHWGHKCGRSLDELAEPIPRGWRLPARSTTEAGRNCALFGGLMLWAGSPFNLEFEVLAVARATNDGLDVPLGDSEVAGLAKSVERYRRSWIAKGRFYTPEQREAWGAFPGPAKRCCAAGFQCSPRRKDHRGPPRRILYAQAGAAIQALACCCLESLRQGRLAPGCSWQDYRQAALHAGIHAGAPGR